MSDATFTFRVDETLKSEFPPQPETVTATPLNSCVTSYAISCGSNRKPPIMSPGFVDKCKPARTRPMPAT